MRSELFKTALQSYKDEWAKCLQEGGEGKRVASFLEKIDHQIPLSQHMFDVAYQHQQSKVDELQKRLGELIKHLDGMGEKSWAVWESSAEMYEQGRADAYWAVKDLLEQALNGDQYEENRKKAEDAISNGASLTKHRIEL